MRPLHVVEAWIEAFNHRDLERIVELYARDCVVDLPPQGRRFGKDAVRSWMRYIFTDLGTTAAVENLLCDRDWVVLEWSEPLGFQGCNIFRISDSRIVLQRSYWDQAKADRLFGRAGAAQLVA